MEIDLIREDIEYEQLLGENTADTVVKEEYVIPDTHPDVREILMLDVKASINSKEIIQDKVYLEGEIKYNVLYITKDQERTDVENVVYSSKFSNTIDIMGAKPEMLCDAECFVEHMECKIINERKICLEGVLKLKSEVYKDFNFQIVKDIDAVKDVQYLKNPTSIDKVIRNFNGELVGKANIKIPMEKPEIAKIIKCDVNIHKKEVKLYEGKIQINAYGCINIVYKGRDSRELTYMEHEVMLNKELDFQDVNPYMDNYTDFSVDAMEFDIKEDDLGEKRIVDVEFLIKTNTRAMRKEEMDIIEDVYSPTTNLEMDKKDYDLNVMQGQLSTDTLVKGDIELNSSMARPNKVIMCNASVCVTDKKVMEDKVVIEGIMNVTVLYRSDDEEKYLSAVSDEIPFTCGAEVLGAKINMSSVCKVSLENINADIEAGNIAVRAVVKVYVRVNYMVQKKFLVDVYPVEGEVPKKRASITIYVVQSGDTLWKIAKKYNTTIQEIARVNAIEDPNVVKVSQKLIIPGRVII
jgi:LysM repeat protein